MPTIRSVGGKVQLEIERLDGGLNTKDSISTISPYESPDCKNVVFTDEGSVQTRSGTTYVGAAINTSNIDGQASYNSSHIIWGGGRMFRYSSSTWTQVTTASGKFASGANVAATVFQGVLFMSDGTNGPYRYEGAESFYNMGIGIPASPQAASGTAGTSGPAAGTYYYKVAFVNTAVVTGEASSAVVGPTITTTATINVTSIPVGTGLYGVAARKIYRASTSAGTYRLVKTLSDNVTTSFTDTMALGAEGSAAVDDGTAPTPWTTVKTHKEVIFFDDSSNRSLLRFTNYQNPYISEAGNFFSVAKGMGESVTALGVQDDFLCAFYDKSMIWVYDLTDPSDETTWSRALSPANIGIVGPKALAEVPNGIVFVGKTNGRLTGIYLLSGLDVAETADTKLRTRNIAERIEPTILNWPSSLWSKIAVTSFDGRLYFAIPDSSSSSKLDGILYFDILRLGDKGQPGSWAPWDGITVQNLLVHEGSLYGGSSNGDGRIIQFNSGAYQDATGSAINSYWWSKEYGGEGQLQSWTKDARYVDLWYELTGAWPMYYRIRKDGEAGTGTAYSVDLTPGGAVWGTFVWGNANWGPAGTDRESRVPVGARTGKRFQHRFDNTNTAGRSFKVHRLQFTMNLRRER